MALALIADRPDPVKCDPSRRGPSGMPPADELTDLAVRIVSTWPALSAERKAELGRLLAT